MKTYRATPQTDGLLLKDVVARAELDRRTARYVLDKAIQLGIHEAEGRGCHRRFSIIEAVRLAMCTRLVMLGVPVAKAAAATLWCESRVRAFDVPSMVISDPPYGTDAVDPWTIRIVQTKYLQIRREKLKSLNAKCPDLDLNAYLEIETGQLVPLGQHRKHQVKIEWSLTDLALVLMRATSDGPITGKKWGKSLFGG